MKPVCVITGGGSGMGRATAKLVCEAGYHVILVGRTAAKLESAVAELTEAGHEAEPLPVTSLTVPAAKSWHGTPWNVGR